MIFASPEKKVLSQAEEGEITHPQSPTHLPQEAGPMAQRFDEKRYDSDAEEHCADGDVDPCPCSYVALEEKNSSETIVDKARRQRRTDN